MSKKNLVKLLQESAKLDRCGISLAWSPKHNDMHPNPRMDFTREELEQILEFLEADSLNSSLYRRFLDVYNHYLRCVGEFEEQSCGNQ
jgi:hypothetical protein